MLDLKAQSDDSGGSKNLTVVVDTHCILTKRQILR